ncbi:MAG: hypothetical protein KDA41_08865 [Planctomycetales bacterium]|nr:hypothetical protein [Planctomycetales bacterium]
MKSKAELQSLIEKIAKPESPVGMDAVYVHALILDKLAQIEGRLETLEAASHQAQAESAANCGQD